MKKSRFWLLGGLGLLGFGGFALAACGVTPTQPSFEPIEESSQDKLVNTLFDTRYLEADLDINVSYKDPNKEKADNYRVYGKATASMENLENLAFDASFKLDMNDASMTEKEKLPVVDFDMTYLDDTAYLSISNRNLKLKTDDFGELLDLVLGEGEESSEEEKNVTNLTTSGIAEIITNVANMTFTDKGTYYEYVAHTTGDQPDLTLTSDTDYKLTSIEITGIKYQDFTIGVKMNTNILDSLTNPITSPETEAKPYIDVSTYFGALRKIRNILDEEKVATNYKLELSHYESATPDNIVYLGYTTGVLQMDLKDTVVNLEGDIYINDPATEGHDDYKTKYNGQYRDECIYLDYYLNNGRDPYKLAYTNAGLSDLWEVLGDSDIFGINIFDLIFGASGKEYPILDIITDAKYRDITKYGTINFTTNYIEVDVDNYLLGGSGHGYIRLNLNDETITSLTMSHVDINTYIVDGTFTFTEFTGIKRINKDQYSVLDNLDEIIKDVGVYYRAMEFDLGLDVKVKNLSNNKNLTLNGNASLNLKNTIKGGLDVEVKDFNDHIHTLKLDTYEDANKKNDLYAYYVYQDNKDVAPTSPVKAVASYDSILSIYNSIMEAFNQGSEEGGENLGPIGTIIANATSDTLAKVMHGDMFAILRDESILRLEIEDANDYTIELDKDLLGLNKNLLLEIHLKNDKIDSVRIATQYGDFEVDAKIMMKGADGSRRYITDTSDFERVDNLSTIAKYMASKSTNGTFKFIEQLTNIYETKQIGLDFSGTLSKKNASDTYDTVFSVSNGKADIGLRDKLNDQEDLLDQLNMVVSGHILSQEEDETTHVITDRDLELLIGYQDIKDGEGNPTGEKLLSAKLGKAIKLACKRSEVQEIINSLNELLGRDAANVSETVNAISLPILEYLNNGEYQEIIKAFKGVMVSENDGNVITLTLSNGLLNAESTTTFDLILNIDENGINSIGVKGIEYGDYKLDFEVALRDYSEASTINTSDYINAANVKYVINQIKNIISEKKVIFEITNSTYNDMILDAYVNLDLSKENGVYDVYIKFQGQEDEENHRDIHVINVSNNGSTCYIMYTKNGEVEDAVRLSIEEATIQKITSDIQEMISGEDSYLNEYLSKFIGNLTDMFAKKDETEQTTSEGFDIVSLLYKDYFLENGIKHYEKTATEPEKLVIEVNGSELGLDNNPTLTITFNDNHEIVSIVGGATVETKPVAINFELLDETSPVPTEVTDFKAQEIPAGGWIGADDINVLTGYVKDLGKDYQKAVIDQIEDLMENKKAHLVFDVDVSRRTDVAPLAVFNGTLDVDLHDLSDFKNALFEAKGSVSKMKDNSEEYLFNSLFDIRLVNKTAYFYYAHDNIHEDFRVRYDLTKLDDLTKVINHYSAENPTFKKLVDAVIPSGNVSTGNQTPLNNILSSGNYLDLFRYYVSSNVRTLENNERELVLTFKGSLIGVKDSGATVSIGLDIGSKGIHHLYVNNFYALGYYLSGSVAIEQDDYQDPIVPVNPETYVPLDYVNDILDDVLSLFSSDQKTVKYRLSGVYDELMIDADIDFELNKDNGVLDPKTNEGSIKAAITTGRKTHYVQADVNAQLISMEDYQSDDPEAQARVEEAAENSHIYVSYGDVDSIYDSDEEKPTGHGAEPAAADKMYGALKLSSVFDLVDVFTRVANSEDSRIANIMEIFKTEGPKTLLMQILGGDMEVLLRSKVIDSFTYDAGTQTYRIVLNENLFKLHDDDILEPITVIMRTADKEVGVDEDDNPIYKKYIAELKVSGRYTGQPISLSLTQTNTSIEKIPSTYRASAYNFTSISALADHLINTVLYDDYAFNGTINIRGDISFDFLGSERHIQFADYDPVNISSYMHIVNDETYNVEDYYAKFDLTNIPSISIGFDVPLIGRVAYYVSENRGDLDWTSSSRNFSVYVTNLAQRDQYGAPVYERVLVTDSYGNPVKDKDDNYIYRDGALKRDSFVVIESTSNGHTRRISLTMDQFMDNLSHYLLNFGLGIKPRNNGDGISDVYAQRMYPKYNSSASYVVDDLVEVDYKLYKCIEDTSGTFDDSKWTCLGALNNDTLNMLTSAPENDDFINMWNYHVESDYQPTYSKVLKSYNYYEPGTGFTDPYIDTWTADENPYGIWTANVGLDNLLNNTMLSNCDIALFGGKHTESEETKAFLQYLKASITASVNMIVTGNLYADVDINIDPTTITDELRDAHINELNTYMDNKYDSRTYAQYVLGELGYAA
ncbi:MAG: hypothetical protein E7175_01315 [Erysipelotrichaceae bacterium]|nr:hypothetical protein [Erysipelotrichaceae bacterium]